MRPGTVNLAGYDTAATPLAPGKKDKTLKDTLSSAPCWPAHRSACGPRAAGAYCSCCRASTPPARVAWSSTSSARSARKACSTPPSRRRRRRSGARFPVAYPQGAAAARHRRRLRPVPLRGRARSPGARDDARGGVAPALRRDQRLRGGPRRSTARRSSSASCTSPTRAARAAAGPARRPDKHWKFNEGDIDERAYWSAYQAAFSGMLQTCSTDHAPWYVVPSDHKWYRNWAIGRIAREVSTISARSTRRVISTSNGCAGACSRRSDRARTQRQTMSSVVSSRARVAFSGLRVARIRYHSTPKTTSTAILGGTSRNSPG